MEGSRNDVSAVLALIAEREAADHLELEAAGVPWAVIVHEVEYGHRAVYGPCDPVEACEISERLRNELNAEFPGGEWDIALARLSPPSDVPKERVERDDT